MPFRDMSLNVAAWPRGIVSVSLSHQWHLGPVTADRAEWRSAAGRGSQSKSLRISRGESRKAACLAGSPGCSGEKETASISITVRVCHLSPALKFTAMEVGGQRTRKVV